MPPADSAVVDLLLELEEALYRHIRSGATGIQFKL